MIVALGLPLKIAAIILGCIFSTLFSVFNALGPISNPTPPTAALTEFFHADNSVNAAVGGVGLLTELLNFNFPFT